MKHRVTVTREELSYIVGGLRNRLAELDEAYADGVVADGDEEEAEIVRRLERRLSRVGEWK